MAQRISRAKQSIAASRVPFRLPPQDERALRLGADRSRWDRDAIAEGVALVTDALSAQRLARTSSKQLSPPSTTKPHAPRTPTGRKSWPSTNYSNASPTLPW
jgi:predicted RNA polymerase sigma factor